MQGLCILTVIGMLVGLVSNVHASCGTLCHPGTFLSSSCSCKPCPINTFMDIPLNNASECKLCKKRCGPSLVLFNECNRTHDAVCACKPGKYHHAGLVYCMNCDVCSPGHGAIQSCTTDTNTVCSPCITGKSFSPSRTTTNPCKHCKQCEMGFTIKNNCTLTRDTTCERMIVVVFNTTLKTPKTSKATVTSPGSGGGSSRSQTKRHQDYKIPLLTVLAVLLVVCLVVSVAAVKLCRKRNAQGQQDLGDDSEDGQADEDITVVTKMAKGAPVPDVRHSGLRGRHTRHLRTYNSNRDSSDSSTASLQGDRPLDSEKLVRDLPYQVIGQLALLLNPRGNNNWVRLAGKLNYSKVKVDYFAMEPSNATQMMLADWQTNNTSTVQTLHAHLTSIDRDDAAHVLEVIERS